MSLSSKPVSDVVRLSDRTHTSHVHDELKTRLHERVVERLDLNSLTALSDERAKQELARLLEQLLLRLSSLL